jgi:hypothetical protein
MSKLELDELEVSEDDFNDFSCDTTEDIQHDLAMEYASIYPIPELIKDLENELVKRGESFPKNCKYEYSPYHYGKQKLVYEV